jgi:hypothetical protein
MPRSLFYAACSPPIDLNKARQLLLSEGADGARKLFSTDPDEWAYRHHASELGFVKHAVGLKLRVNVGTVREMKDLLPSLVTLADVVVFSTAPQWQCGYIPTKGSSPWPGFVDGLRGLGGAERIVWFPNDMIEYFAWIASCRPFFESGMVTYLPRCNDQWRNSSLSIPETENADWDDPSQTSKAILHDLFIEHIVSDQLGCIHLDATAARTPLLTRRLPTLSNRGHGEKAYALLKLHVPFVQNADVSELHRILSDERESVAKFRRSIRQAIAELEKTQLDGDRLDAYVDNVQRDLIDEPFTFLKARLRRVEKIRRKKLAPYAISAVAASVLAATGHADLAALAVSGVSILKLMETYYNDVEKDVGLHSDALYWLTRLSRR